MQETFARLLQARPRLDDDALAPFAGGPGPQCRRLVCSGPPHGEAPPAPPGRSSGAGPARGAGIATRRGPGGGRGIGPPAGAGPQRSGRQRGGRRQHRRPCRRVRVDTRSRGRAAGAGAGKLRVNYLLAIRAIDRPTDRCQSVLNALSAGDRRRQCALDAGGHLLECTVCAALSDPLTERRRALAGFLPLALVKPVEVLRGWLHDHPGQALAGTGSLVVGALLATQLLAPDPTVVKPITPAPTTVAPAATTGDRTLTSEGRRSCR